MKASSYWLLVTFAGIFGLWKVIKRWVAPIEGVGTLGIMFIILPFALALITQGTCSNPAEMTFDPWQLGLVVLGIILVAGDASGRFRKHKK
jgi:glycerol uptake facilitator-like aquaporin